MNTNLISKVNIIFNNIKFYLSLNIFCLNYLVDVNLKENINEHINHIINVEKKNKEIDEVLDKVFGKLPEISLVTRFKQFIIKKTKNIITIAKNFMAQILHKLNNKIKNIKEKIENKYYSLKNKYNLIIKKYNKTIEIIKRLIYILVLLLYLYNKKQKAIQLEKEKKLRQKKLSIIMFITFCFTILFHERTYVWILIKNFLWGRRLAEIQKWEKLLRENPILAAKILRNLLRKSLKNQKLNSQTNSYFVNLYVNFLIQCVSGFVALVYSFIGGTWNMINFFIGNLLWGERLFNFEMFTKKEIFMVLGGPLWSIYNFITQGFGGSEKIVFMRNIRDILKNPTFNPLGKQIIFLKYLNTVLERFNSLDSSKKEYIMKIFRSIFVKRTIGKTMEIVRDSMKPTVLSPDGLLISPEGAAIFPRISPILTKHIFIFK